MNTMPDGVVLSSDFDLSTLSKDRLALAIRTLLTERDAALHRERLRNLNLSSLERLRLEERKAYVLTLFEAVGSLRNNPLMLCVLQRDWWACLREPIAGPQVEDTLPLRDHLSRRLPILQLTWVVFASRSSRLSVGSQLAAKYPEALRMAARNIADLRNEATIEAITKAAETFTRVESVPLAIDAASSELAVIPVTNHSALPRMLAVLGLAHPTQENSVPGLVKYSQVIRYSQRRGNSDVESVELARAIHGQ